LLMGPTHEFEVYFTDEVVLGVSILLFLTTLSYTKGESKPYLCVLRMTWEGPPVVPLL